MANISSLTPTNDAFPPTSMDLSRMQWAMYILFVFHLGHSLIKTASNCLVTSRPAPSHPQRSAFHANELSLFLINFVGWSCKKYLALFFKSKIFKTYQIVLVNITCTIEIIQLYNYTIEIISSSYCMILWLYGHVHWWLYDA